MGRPPLGQLRVDAAVPQLLPLLLVIKAPVAHHVVRVFPGVAGLTSDGRDGIYQRHGLIGVRSVRRDGVDDQRHALTIGENRVFAAQFRAINGTGTRFFTPADGADMARVHDEPLEVDPVRMTEVVQQDLVDLVPTPAACQSASGSNRSCRSHSPSPEASPPRAGRS